LTFYSRCNNIITEYPMPHIPEYLRALSTALNWALVPEPRCDPPRTRVAFWASDAFICRRRLGLQFMEVPRDPMPGSKES